MKAPSIEASYEMGAKGGPIIEAERIAFESWMRGHCWAVSETWNGKYYEDSLEYLTAKMIDPLAMDTRRLWAVWRDRAALTPSIDINNEIEMNINELKPCPFCGNTDISGGEVLTEHPNGKVTIQSMCMKCGALGAEAILKTGEIDYGSIKANKAWNMRA